LPHRGRGIGQQPSCDCIAAALQLLALRATRAGAAIDEQIGGALAPLLTRQRAVTCEPGALDAGDALNALAESAETDPSDTPPVQLGAPQLNMSVTVSPGR